MRVARHFGAATGCCQTSAGGRQQAALAPGSHQAPRPQQWRQHRRRTPAQHSVLQARCQAASASDNGEHCSSSGRGSSRVAGRGQQESCSAAVLPRRALLTAAVAAAIAASAPPGPAAASLLPEAVDKAWEGIGGGPSDLVFPDEFLGVWDVDSVLTQVELPLGPEFVPNMQVVQRAQQQDLNSVVKYKVAFLQNQRGEVVPDRSFNTASLMETYTGNKTADVQRRIEWNPDDPNLLEMTLPGGLEVSTRVTRRSVEEQPGDRLLTSEYFLQLITTPASPQPKTKASQCFTKYHWRSAAEAEMGMGGGVRIVATQVVSDYLTAFDDPMRMMEAGGKPVVVYTYRMAFRRRQPAAPGAAPPPAAPPAVVAA